MIMKRPASCRPCCFAGTASTIKPINFQSILPAAEPLGLCIVDFAIVFGQWGADSEGGNIRHPMHSKAQSIQSSAEALRYPWENHPGPDQVVEVMPGILWVRLKLPFRLNHVNIYFVEDGGGLALIDTGIDNAASRAAWEALLAGPLAGHKLTRIIATHFHPDHIGLAGWLCERFECSVAVRIPACSSCRARRSALCFMRENTSTMFIWGSRNKCNNNDVFKCFGTS